MTRGIVVKILHYNKITSTCNPVKFQSLKKNRYIFSAVHLKLYQREL